jgi:hypothetical protein
MMMRRTILLLLATVLVLIGMAPGAAVAAAESALRDIPPATVVMEFPEELGAMQRPAVEFDHAAHTKALEAEGCEKCHTVDDKGLTPALTSTLNVSERKRLIDVFHDTCMGCHEQRAAESLKAGPVTCGECHQRRPPGESERVAMAFDYSLHARHARTYPEKCDTCHHVYDEVEKKLRYEKDKEEACRACHGAEDVEKNLSLANASHRQCIACHIDRARQQIDGGPVECVGCHEAATLREIKPLEEIPRLVRGQPDSLWVKAPGATSAMVAFNHSSHEPQQKFCTTCHHDRLRSCAECHGLTAASDGGGVTLERAHHMESSEYSCTGCHRRVTSNRDCAGCHRGAILASGQGACKTCHDGPRPSQEEPPPIQAGSPQVAELAELPAASDDFPEKVKIDVLAAEYEASEMPHLKILARLDAPIRSNRLARHFHGAVEAMCAGCHHHSPAGERPPRCAACHGPTAAATVDKPGLKVAYHRQCIGCHQRMGIDKQGCTDCHAEREVAP